MGRKLKIAGAIVAAAAGALFVANTDLLAPAPTGRIEFLAHRGVHQTFSGEDLKGDTCTAERIDPPRHPLIENTLDSIDAAFTKGADLVEFDVQPTTDGQFAVFHDWTLDCRTDGKGVTREKSMDELRELDVGYGYTADGGKTYPLRGLGSGLMPTLEEVLSGFPRHRFLIHVKSRDAAEGQLLAKHLGRLPPEERSHLMVYGDDVPLGALKAALPGQRIAARGRLKDCLIRYAALGWSGYMPETCRDGAMFVPSNVGPWLWGWPNRLAARLEAAGSKLIVLGPYNGGDFSTGVDSVQDLRALPVGFSGAIWTNRIEEIGPLAREE